MWPQLWLSSCIPSPHLFQVVSGRLLSLKAFDSIPLASPMLLWETVGDHSMHGKVSLLRAKCAGWWTELHCLCVRMIWGQCWSFNNAENKFISLCASSCAHFCGKGNCQTWNTEEQGRFYAKLVWVEKPDCFKPQRQGRENRGSLYQRPPCTSSFNWNGKKINHFFVRREQECTAWTLAQQEQGREESSPL